ncbi:Peptidase family M50 [Fragilaria crotonensis]|nr:Peptidase family M50 [Fragilaria crotonensis]
MEQQPQLQQQQQLWVFELCALGGVPISIHYTMLLLVIIQVFAATLSYQDRTYNALMFLLYGPILLITAFIHELGHAVAARNLGGFVDRIVLWPLGGFTVFGSSDGAVVDDLWIAISGPLTHVLQGAFWLGIYALINRGDLSSFSTAIQRQELRNGGVGEFTSILSEQALLFNVIIFIFNVCVPAYPLDGGRALAALLVMGGHKLGTTARITSALGTFVGIVMLFVGVYWVANVEGCSIESTA